MPKFAKYVSAVAGRLASRPGSPHAYIGARLTTVPERKAAEEAGEDPVPAIWDENLVVAITEREYLARPLDWENLIKFGDGRERTKEDFEAYVKALEGAEKKRDTKLADEAKAAAEKSKKAEANQPGGSS